MKKNLSKEGDTMSFFDHELEQKFFNEYVRLGGTHDKQTYMKNLDEFIELTIDAFVNGCGHREKSMRKWYKFIGGVEEGNRYFDSVDNVGGYT